MFFFARFLIWKERGRSINSLSLSLFPLSLSSLSYLPSFDIPDRGSFQIVPCILTFLFSLSLSLVFAFGGRPNLFRRGPIKFRAKNNTKFFPKCFLLCCSLKITARENDGGRANDAAVFAMSSSTRAREREEKSDL